jgi:hypothetical protein
MEIDRIIAEEVRRDDKKVVGPTGELSLTIERYILTVLPENIQSVIRAVALYEITQQERIGNPPSQIIVDNMPISKRGIDTAKRRVVARFQDVRNLLEAVKEIFQLLQRVTRLQMPPKDAVVARQNFYLYLNRVNLGLMPGALAKISYPGVLTQDSVVRVVGPLVPYGRKLFWNPVGVSKRMAYYRVKSKKAGVRFLVPRGSDIFYPRFKPYKLSTTKRKARGNAQLLQAMLAGDTPPGRAENVGQMVKRIVQRNPRYRGLYFSDAWIDYPPAVGWSKLRDPRVPTVGVMFTKRGKLNTERG